MRGCDPGITIICKDVGNTLEILKCFYRKKIFDQLVAKNMACFKTQMVVAPCIVLLNFLASLGRYGVVLGQSMLLL